MTEHFPVYVHVYIVGLQYLHVVCEITWLYTLGGLPVADDEGQNSRAAIFWSLVVVLAGTGNLWHHQTEDTIFALHWQCEITPLSAISPIFSFTQNGVQDVFRFVTFVLQYVTYIAQFVLNLFQEPTSKKYSTIDVTQVNNLWSNL